MKDSTPRRSCRASARASRYGDATEQLTLAVDERPWVRTLYAAVRRAYDDYERQAREQQRGAGR